MDGCRNRLRVGKIPLEGCVDGWMDVVTTSEWRKSHQQWFYRSSPSEKNPITMACGQIDVLQKVRSIESYLFKNVIGKK